MGRRSESTQRTPDRPAGRYSGNGVKPRGEPCQGLSSAVVGNASAKLKPRCYAFTTSARTPTCWSFRRSASAFFSETPLSAESNKYSAPCTLTCSL